MKKLFDWIIEKWLAGFITATIFFILKLYIDLPIDQRGSFFNWTTTVLESKIDVWKCILVVLFIIIMSLISKWWKNHNKNSLGKYLAMPKDPVYKYRVDTFGFDKAKWTWDYEWNGLTQKSTVVDVMPLCPVCNAKLVINRAYPLTADCPKCRLEGRNSYFQLNQTEHDVTTEILRLLHTGEWAGRMK